MAISKTDYLLFRECHKNAWLRLHLAKADFEKIAGEPSDFEKAIMETGNEVENVARGLFPNGILIQGRSEEDEKQTQELLARKTPVIFQGLFVKDGFLAAVDILELNADGTHNIYEVKATTDVDKKTHYHDLTFQIELVQRCGLEIKTASVIHLNNEYIRRGELELHKLFTTADVTEKVKELGHEVELEMGQARTYLGSDKEPEGRCDCVYKGRSSHCATFGYSNPDIPKYGVHDISRIGASKAKLQDLVDIGVLQLEDIPEDRMKKLSPAQQNQIFVYVHDTILMERQKISSELESLQFPLYFLDYETFPSAIPRFDGFSPYQQIPFQYSLYVLDALGGQLQHFEFLHEQNTDPSLPFLQSLQSNIGQSGSIIVWNKKFECKINEELAVRNLQYKDFIATVSARVYDLMDIFGNQYYVHKDFRGRISIKNVLPVLAPELSYQDLEIKEGGTASQKWNEAVTEFMRPEEKQKIFTNLKEYCKLDTYAMYMIWSHLCDIVNSR